MNDLKIAELESQVETLQRRNSELEAKILQAETTAERATVESRLRVAAIAAGAVPAAVDSLIAHSMLNGQWKLDSQGKLLRQTEDGKPDVDIAGNYVTPEAWMKTQSKSSGWIRNCFTDAQEAAATTNSGETNPWLPHSWNLTQQGRVLSMSKSDAERMAREAGVPLYGTQPKPTK